MADQTRDQQRTAGVQMDDGDNTGKEVGKPLRPEERERQQKTITKDDILLEMMDSVEANKADLVSLLKPLDIDYDFFRSCLRLALLKSMRDDDKFHTASQTTFIESVIRAAKDGVVPDGKEGAIVRYAAEFQYQPMRDGMVKVIWSTGMVRDINDNVVTENEEKTGRFKYMEGDAGFIEHQKDLNRKDTDVIVAAYCVINLNNGGKIIEIVPKADLEKIAATAKSQKARGAWKLEMHRKAAIRRAVKRMPKTRRLSQMIAHDDLNYDLNRVAPSGSRPIIPVDRRNLFADKAAVPAPDQADVAPKVVVEDEPVGHSEAVIAAIERVNDAEDFTAFFEVTASIEQDPALQDLFGEESLALTEAMNAKQQKLSRGALVLTAILNSEKGEQTFDDAEIWLSDLLAKMDATSGKTRKAFWTRNVEFILAAKEAGVEQADRLFAVAKGHGLTLPAGAEG